jgi:hypothetical protein
MLHNPCKVDILLYYTQNLVYFLQSKICNRLEMLFRAITETYCKDLSLSVWQTVSPQLKVG